jgi:hypothetical protein
MGPFADVTMIAAAAANHERDTNGVPVLQAMRLGGGVSQMIASEPGEIVREPADVEPGASPSEPDASPSEQLPGDGQHEAVADYAADGRVADPRYNGYPETTSLSVDETGHFVDEPAPAVPMGRRVSRMRLTLKDVAAAKQVRPIICPRPISLVPYGGQSTGV